MTLPLWLFIVLVILSSIVGLWLLCLFIYWLACLIVKICDFIEDKRKLRRKKLEFLDSLKVSFSRLDAQVEHHSHILGILLDERNQRANPKKGSKKK